MGLSSERFSRVSIVCVGFSEFRGCLAVDTGSLCSLPGSQKFFFWLPPILRQTLSLVQVSMSMGSEALLLS